jgi:hypothetical protein
MSVQYATTVIESECDYKKLSEIMGSLGFTQGIPQQFLIVVMSRHVQ